MMNQPVRVSLKPSLLCPVLAGPAVVHHDVGVASLQPAVQDNHVSHLTEQSLTDAVLRVLRTVRIATKPSERPTFNAMQS